MTGSWIAAEDARLEVIQAFQDGQVDWLDVRPEEIERTARIARRQLEAAEPIWVAPEMAPLIEAAVASWRPEAWRHEDLFILDGFAVVPVMAWPQDPSEKADPNVVEEYLRSGTRIAIQWAAATKPGDTGTLLWLWFMVPGKTPAVWLAGSISDGRVVEDASFVIRTVQVILRLLGERVVRVRQEPTPRQARRRAERAQITPAATVRVVELRRSESRASDTQRSVEWSRRWIVAGHWRNQWRPKHGDHRQTWVGSYVKGPPDRPLVVARNVYELDR